MAAPTYPFTLHVEPTDQDENLAEVVSYADLVSQIEAIAEVPRAEATTLAQKVQAGQEVNVAASGTGLRLYATQGDTTGEMQPEPTGTTPPSVDPASLSDEARAVLEPLRRDPAQNRLVHDDADRRWYVYEFTEEPPRITDVRREAAEGLVESGAVVRAAESEARRVDLPGGFSVYTTPEGAESTPKS